MYKVTDWTYISFNLFLRCLISTGSAWRARVSNAAVSGEKKRKKTVKWNYKTNPRLPCFQSSDYFYYFFFFALFIMMGFLLP